MFFILTSSCARYLPKRRGYSSVSNNRGMSPTGLSRQPEDANRLIDELDEEWNE